MDDQSFSESPVPPALTRQNATIDMSRREEKDVSVTLDVKIPEGWIQHQEFPGFWFRPNDGIHVKTEK